MAGFDYTAIRCADECTGVFNAQVTKTTGIWVSNGWVQLSAFLCVCLSGWQQEETLL